MTADPGTPQPCRRCRTGRPRPPTCRRRSGRSRPRCGPASRPPAARVEEVFAVVEQRVAARVAEIAADEGARRDGLAGHRLRRHRGRHRPRRGRWRSCAGAAASSCAATSRASRPWPGTRDIVDYVESNRFFENYRGPGDDFFGSVGSKPEIYPIYWSPAQMQARQSDRMARVQAFLNAPVDAASPTASSWFDPDRDSLYPDRIRRRPAGRRLRRPGHPPRPRHARPVDDRRPTRRRSGTSSTAPSSSTTRGTPPTAPPARSTPARTMCSAFRTFQGWTALSDMDHDQGVLHTVPIPEAMAYLMLRPLLADVPDDDMCGVTANQVFPASEKWHPLLLRGRQRHPRRQGRRLRLVALRHDPQRRPGHRPEGLGQRHVHPRRALVPPQRGVRRQRARGVPHRLQPERLPRGALRARPGTTASRPTTSTTTGRRGLGLD